MAHEKCSCIKLSQFKIGNEYNACTIFLSKLKMSKKGERIRINVFEHTILDGLDVTKQEFTGTISKATEVSQIVQTEGALDFEDVVIHNDKFNKYNYQGQSKYYKQLSIFFHIYHFIAREWPQVQADFFLKRRHLDHILLSFFPTTCLVVLSWISFLIPPYIVPGRMVLLVTLLLVVISTYQKQQ